MLTWPETVTVAMLGEDEDSLMVTVLPGGLVTVVVLSADGAAPPTSTNTVGLVGCVVGKADGETWIVVVDVEYVYSVVFAAPLEGWSSSLGGTVEAGAWTDTDIVMVF